MIYKTGFGELKDIDLTPQVPRRRRSGRGSKYRRCTETIKNKL